MAVEVYPTENDYPHPYEKAQKVSVDTGLLTVTGDDRDDVMAVYAPGNWHHIVMK
jgi:hypothetical protein